MIVSAQIRVGLPFDGAGLLAFLAHRAVTGVEVVGNRTYARTLSLPHGPGIAHLSFPDSADSDVVTADFTLSHADDLVVATARCRRLLDADADATAIDAVIAADHTLAESVRRTPGIRLPGAVDGAEILFRAILGQQVSVAAARTAAARLTRVVGRRLDPELATDGLTHLFAGPAELAPLSEADIGGPRRRAAALLSAARGLADGTLVLEHDGETAEMQAELCARPGIGPWTAGYVAMRVLGDPDVLLTPDLVLRQGAVRLGLPSTPRELADYGRRWRPVRSYAGLHLWRNATTIKSQLDSRGCG